MGVRTELRLFSTKLKSAVAAPRAADDPLPMSAPLPLTQIGWRNYFQSVRRIVAEFNRNHGNYRIHDHEFVEIVLIVEGTLLHHPCWAIPGPSQAMSSFSAPVPGTATPKSRVSASISAVSTPPCSVGS